MTRFMTDAERNFFRLAYLCAKTLSDDPHTQNGAVLVSPEGNVLGKGANQFPAGVKVIAERQERPLKYDFMVHAEQAAILAAARFGQPTIGATLYCPWAACMACARFIIHAGIVRVITHAEMHRKTPERWQTEIERAVDLFAEAGVEYTQVKGGVGGVCVLFDEKEWSP